MSRPRALLLAGLLLAAACGPPPDPESGIVRAALYTDPQTLSLIGKTDMNSLRIASVITDSLVQYDAALKLRPMLATSWEIAPDGLTVTFTLREGVRWHDGAPFTSRDVLFTVEKARDPATENKSAIVQFESLLSLEALGDHAVRARYSEPYADVLDAWTLPIIPAHLAGLEDDLLTSEFADHPVGCGPFRFVRREPGEEVVLEANSDYWGGKPAIEGMTFRIMPDDRTAYQALLKGDLHIMGVPPDIWREAESSGAADRLGKMLFYRPTVWYIAWHQDGSNPFFTDSDVRRAMVLALDRETFCDRILGGLGRPAVTSYHPVSPWADPELPPWPYDPEEARRLLDRAGWKDDDGDGVRERGGRDFAFTLMMPKSRQEISDRIAAWIQQSLDEIGVSMQIEPLEWKSFLERRAAGQFEAAMAQLTFDPYPDQAEVYHSSSRDAGFNFFGLSDPELDRLLEEGRVTFDADARRRIYHRVQKRLHELEPISCLFHFASPVLHDPDLEGIESSPRGLWRSTPGPRAWRWAKPSG